MANSMSFNGLHPPLFEEERGNDGVSQTTQINFSKVSKRI